MWLFGIIPSESAKHLNKTYNPPFFIYGIGVPQITLLNSAESTTQNGEISMKIKLTDMKQFEDYIIDQVYIAFFDKSFYDQYYTNVANSNNSNSNSNKQPMTQSDIHKETMKQIKAIPNYTLPIIDSKDIFGQRKNKIDTNSARNGLTKIDGSQFILHRESKDNFQNKFYIVFDQLSRKNQKSILNEYYMIIQCCVRDPCLSDNHKNQLPRSCYACVLIPNIAKPQRPLFTYENDWMQAGLIKNVPNGNGNNNNNNNNNGQQPQQQQIQSRDSPFVVELDSKTDEEYSFVHFSFFSSLSKTDYEILTIYKVYNHDIAEESHLHFRKMCLKKFKNNKEKLNEMSLWHGTDVKHVESILFQGFQKALCARAAYGQGCYFARDAIYSAQPQFSPIDKDGIKHMLSTSVIVGEYCKGRIDMKIPDTKPNSKEMYESTVNNIDEPTIIITHSDWQAIPRYIISFKKK